MNDIDFIKMSAGGNDFILIKNRDDRFLAFSFQPSDFVKEVCQRKRSIGADGVLLLERSKSCDIKMRVFNPDGSEVEMCGNGARCVALYVARWAKSKIKNQKSKINIETKAGILEAEVIGDARVRLKIQDPKNLRLDFGLEVGGERLQVNYIDTGVPHVVCFVDDLDGVDVINLGKAIRYYPEFQPAGTNADFVKVIDAEIVNVRTYERGVEDETLSCGTGAVACAIIAARVGRVEPPVWVQTKGGDRLKVYFDIEGDQVRNVYLEGGAKFIYEGRIEVMDN